MLFHFGRCPMTLFNDTPRYNFCLIWEQIFSPTYFPKMGAKFLSDIYFKPTVKM